jgi:hypothetical protein
MNFEKNKIIKKRNFNIKEKIFKIISLIIKLTNNTFILFSKK